MLQQRPAPVDRQRAREGEVVRAATEVFCAKGYSAATLADVADRLGMLKGSLYYYVHSKEHLLVKVFESLDEDARALLVEAATGTGPALVRLSDYVHGFLLFALDRGELMRLYALEWVHLTGAHREAIVARRNEVEGVVRDLVRQAQAEGSVSPDVDDRHAAYYLLSAINAVPLWFRRDGGDSPEAIAGAYARLTTSLLSGAAPT
jgi:AcrR family transcriptional regulator